MNLIYQDSEVAKQRKHFFHFFKYVVLRSMRSIADKDILSNPTKSVHRHDFVNFVGLSFSAETLGLLLFDFIDEKIHC